MQWPQPSKTWKDKVIHKRRSSIFCQELQGNLSLDRRLGCVFNSELGCAVAHTFTMTACGSPVLCGDTPTPAIVFPLCLCTVVVVKLLSGVRLFVTPWTVACQSPLSMGFSRQEYWSELPFPSPRDLPKPGMEPGSPALQADSLPIELRGKHHVSACTYAKLLSHVASLRLYEPYRLPSSLVQGILQARVLEWVAMLSSRVSSQPRDQTLISYVSCIGRQVLVAALPGKPCL